MFKFVNPLIKDWDLGSLLLQEKVDFFGLPRRGCQTGMSNRLEETDQQIQTLLQGMKGDRGRFIEARNALFRLLEGPVKGFAFKDLATFRRAAPFPIRLDAVENWWVENFRKAFEYLEKADWKIGDGFGVVNKNKVKNPSSLRVCLTAALIRDARKECDNWLKHAPRDPAENEEKVYEAEPSLAELEEILRAHKALQQLPAELRESFIYHKALGWSSRSIADIVGIGHVQVQRRIRKAEKLLSDYLGNES